MALGWLLLCALLAHDHHNDLRLASLHILLQLLGLLAFLLLRPIDLLHIFGRVHRVILLNCLLFILRVKHMLLAQLDIILDQQLLISESLHRLL